MNAGVVLVTALMLSAMSSPTNAALERSGFPSPNDRRAILAIVAHQDDDLYFMNPELQRAIRRGDEVAVVYLTAGNYHPNAFDPSTGDADDTRYWRDRQLGVMAAYARMHGTDGPLWTHPECSNDVWWTRADLSIAGSATGTSLSFLALNAGEYLFEDPEAARGDVWGGSDNYLKELFGGNITMMTFNSNPQGESDAFYGENLESFPPSRSCNANVTRSDLVDALVQMLISERPTDVFTLDPTKIFANDHTDHIQAALFAQQAVHEYRRMLISSGEGASSYPRVTFFRTYNLDDDARGLMDGDFNDKCAAVRAYDPFDRGVGSDGCLGGARMWIANRSGMSQRLRERGVRFATHDGSCLSAEGASLGLKSCARRGRALENQRWTLTTSGTIRHGSLCLTTASSGPKLKRCDRSSIKQQWTVLPVNDIDHDWSTNILGAQVRGPWGRCLQVNGPSPSTAACLSLTAQSKGADVRRELWQLLAAPPVRRSDDFSDAQGWGLHETYFATLRLGDVDGDSYDDLCGRGTAGIWCARNKGNGRFGNEILVQTYFSDDNGWKDPARGLTIMFADINGDGRADVCGRHEDGIHCALAGPTFGTFDDSYLALPWFTDQQGWALLPSYYGSIRLGDVDGDARADICGRGSAGIWCGHNVDGRSFAEPFVVHQQFSDEAGWDAAHYGTTIQLGDVDSDGRMDVCGRGEPFMLGLEEDGSTGYAQSDGLFCARSISSPGQIQFEQLARWSYHNDFRWLVGWNDSQTYYGSIRLGDVNGDGRADVCGLTPVGLACGYSDGVEFGPLVTTVRRFTSTNWSDPAYGLTIQLGRVNGDPRSDLCGRTPKGVACSLSPR